MSTTRGLFGNLFGGKDHHTCEVCGNEYDKAFEVKVSGETHIFDSFECAIQALAPTCAHCGCRIIGHGMEANGVYYCCAHCASQHRLYELEDRPTAERSPA